jgi:HPt (histidine-containing phosphotransfer) domain-containing protein
VRDADLANLDRAVIEELLASVEGDHAFVAELMDAYLTDAPIQLAAIDDAAAAQDAAALVRPAHTLKSSSATLGLRRLAAAARELEMAGRTGALDATVGEAVETLHADWDAGTAALHAWVAEAGNG